MNTTSQLGAPTPTPAHFHRSSSKISTNNRNSQFWLIRVILFPVGCCAVLVVGCRKVLLVGCCVYLFFGCCVAFFVGCCTALFVGCFAALHSLVCQLLCGHFVGCCRASFVGFCAAFAANNLHYSSSQYPHLHNILIVRIV